MWKAKLKQLTYFQSFILEIIFQPTNKSKCNDFKGNKTHTHTISIQIHPLPDLFLFWGSFSLSNPVEAD